MTDTTDDTTAPEAAVKATEAAATPQLDPDTAPAGETAQAAQEGANEPDDKSGAEAARYRRRLRDTEAERDTLAADRDRLRGLLADRQRADVEALAGERLRDPSDLWTAVELADVLDDEGEVDGAKVTEAVEQLASAKPHYVATRPGFDLGVRGEPTKRAASMADVLRGSERR